MNPLQAVNDFLPSLEAWFGKLMLELYSGPRDHGDGILMGCPVWGQKYIHQFQHYCLPSMMSEKNRAVLEDNCRMVLFTSQPCVAAVTMLAKALRAMRIDCRIWMIPNDVMEQLPPPGADLHPEDGRWMNKYWLLGTSGNALMQMGGEWQMGLHLLFPDVIYSEAFFSNLIRLSQTHQGIAQSSISARTEVLAEVEQYRARDNTISLSGQILGDMGFRHIHQQIGATIMNDATPQSMPNSHLLAWQAEDKLVIHSPHCNMAWLSAEMCAKAPIRIPATIDSELPSFMPANFYTPKAHDDMTFIEVSDETKTDGGASKRIPFRRWAKLCWEKVRFQEDWMPYLRDPSELPILPRNEFVDEAEIERQFNMLVDGMYELRAPLAYEFINDLAFK